MKNTCPILLTAVSLGVAVATGLSGCTAQEESSAISAITNAVTDLSANRALAERFVRDVKSSDLSPTSEAYEQARTSYDHAIRANNHYIDVLEGTGLGGSSRGWQSSEAVLQARDASAEFLADATAALDPSGATRKVKFNRAVTIPEDLPQKMRRLKKQDREEIMGRIDPLVRWDSWGDI